MNGAGQAREAARTAERRLRGPADSAQGRGLSERCLIWQHEGPPIVPTGYNSNLQIHQVPGFVDIARLSGADTSARASRLLLTGTASIRDT